LKTTVSRADGAVPGLAMEFKSLSKRNIVVLTGAGISKESGLDTFRCADGIWARVRLEDVATPEAFVRNPALVHQFYNARRNALADPAVVPNAAHVALARLEHEWPGEVLVVTQNIDDLHDRAGTHNLVHMHGELKKIRCQRCSILIDWLADLAQEHVCPTCGRSGQLRPHVVWFGEMPLEIERIYAALDACDLFMSVGTSGNVYPAAGFVRHVKEWTTARTVELNLEPSTGAGLFDEAIYGAATVSVPRFVDRLLAEAGIVRELP
jgi:NAD-dependent deacetylase